MNTKHAVFGLLLLVNVISIEASAPQAAKVAVTAVAKSSGVAPLLLFASGVAVGTGMTYTGHKFYQANGDFEKTESLIHKDFEKFQATINEATNKQYENLKNLKYQQTKIVVDKLKALNKKISDKLDLYIQDKPQTPHQDLEKENQGGSDNDRRD